MITNRKLLSAFSCLVQMVWNMTRATTFSAIINSFSVFCLHLPSNLNWIFWNYEMFKIKKKAWQLVAQSAPFIVTSSFLQKMSVNMISLVDFYVWFFFFSLTHSSNIAAICSSFPPPRTGSLHFFLIFSLICIFLFISSTQVALFIFFLLYTLLFFCLLSFLGLLVLVKAKIKNHCSLFFCNALTRESA